MHKNIYNIGHMIALLLLAHNIIIEGFQAIKALYTDEIKQYLTDEEQNKINTLYEYYILTWILGKDLYF